MYIKKHIKSYIAGIMDGEGSIGFQRTKNTKGNNYIYPRIYVYNTDKRLMLFIQKFYNGYIRVQSISANTKTKKKVYRLHFNLKDMTIFLKDIYPFLLIKQEQSKLCLKFITTKRKLKRDKKGRVKKLHPKIIIFRKKLYKSYQLAQRKGKSLYPGKTVTRW